MKLFLLSFFVAAAFAAPAPLDEETGEPVELIVNGVPEGEPLEIGDVLGIKVKKHLDGVIVSSADLLHPLTAAGLEDADAGNRPVLPEVPEIEVPEIEVPEIEVPEIEVPEVEVPEIEVPGVYDPEIIDGPEVVVLPPPQIPELVHPPVNTPQLVPEDIVIPPVSPPVIPEIQPPILPEVLPPVGPAPEPPLEDVPEVGAEFPNGEVFNNGVVQVTLNRPETGYFANVQSWFNMVLNYFNGYEVTTHQIV